MIRTQLTALASLVLTSAAPVDAAPLLYPRPELVAPTTVELDTGPTLTRLDPARDYVVKLPAVRKQGSTVIVGGHNVIIVGGEIGVPKGDTIHRALQIKGATGTVHVEGLLIDVSDDGADAIVIDAPQAVAQIENVRVQGVHGFFTTWHADCLQPWGGVRSLRVDRFTCYTGYQGIQFTALKGPIGEVRLSRVNLVSTGAQIWGRGFGGGNGGYLIWFQCNHKAPVTLDRVYLQPRTERGPKLAVYPPANGSTKCPSTLASNHKAASFPRLPITGEVLLGKPPSGDFVSRGSVGIGYGVP